MKSFDIARVIELNDAIAEEFGGTKGYRKARMGYLASALNHALNDDYYPTFLDKLTHIVFSCVKFRPFVDNNARTALALGIYFLELNRMEGYFVHFAVRMERIIAELMEGGMTKDELKAKLKRVLY